MQYKIFFWIVIFLSFDFRFNISWKKKIHYSHKNIKSKESYDNEMLIIRKIVQIFLRRKVFSSPQYFLYKISF